MHFQFSFAQTFRRHKLFGLHQDYRVPDEPERNISLFQHQHWPIVKKVFKKVCHFGLNLLLMSLLQQKQWH